MRDNQRRMVKFASHLADTARTSHLPLTSQLEKVQEWSPRRMALKRIEISQLIPGMYVVEMDVPWYRTPFLSHKRLINDQQTIQIMKDHGIRMITIDTTKGRDVPALTPETPSAPVESPSASPNLSEPQAHSDAPEPATPQMNTAPEPKREESLSTVIYAQAQEAVERIFDDLERGIPPSPETAKAIVSNVLSQVLSERAAMATQVAIQQIKQFDRSLAAHALDTCVLSLIVAIESGFDTTLQEQIGTGALLHDTGYVRLPRNLVRKRDECTGQDKVLLQQHGKLGVALLSKQQGFDEQILRIVSEHHERANGSGFPAGLRNENISRLAQIIGIVDFYDGMVSHRGAKPNMIPHDAVRQLFLAGESGLFEKSLVEIMIRSIGVYPIGSLVRLNTGEQAVVVGANPQQRLKPLIKVISDAQGRSYPTPLLLDLANPASHEQSVRSVLRVLDPTQERVHIAMHLDERPAEAA